jgi:hypothetical protein
MARILVVDQCFPRGEWNEQRFQQFSQYDGVNLQTMENYGEKFKGDKT